jgi:hypothetical protein
MADQQVSTQVSLEKARGFVIDESGRPAPGVAVLASVELDDGRKLPVGMLASDAAGYVSFDLRDAISQGPPVQVHLTPVGDAAATVTIATGLDVPFLLQVSGQRRTDCDDGGHAGPAAARRSDLPAVQRPDPLDWKLSPGSFVADRPIVVGEGACQVLLPTEAHKFATTTYRFTQVVRRFPLVDEGVKTHGFSASNQDTGEALNELGLARLSSGTPADSSEGSGTAMLRMVPPPPPGTPSLATGISLDLSKPLEAGQVLSFRQTWSPLGHSLGKIAYSLPLAPCESVNIAIIDWSRSDQAVRADQAKSTENLVHSQRRDRSIDEVIDATLSESQGGWSLQLGVGGAIGGPGQALAGGLGYGTAQSWGQRDLTSSSLQDLHDSILQKTSVVRQLNSTVVVQSSQQEKNYVETRTVTNHNHCHALTVQYHEVLQHLRVDTRYESRRWALLIPYKLLAFDWQTALRYRTILETVLLEPKLAACFDAIVRVHYCQAAYPKPVEDNGGSAPGEHPATPVQPTIQRFELALKSGDSPTYGRVRVQLLFKGEWKQLFLKPSVLKGGPEIPKNQWLRYSITSGEAIGVERKDIKKVRVGWFENDPDDDWWLDGIEIKYETATQPGLVRLLYEEGDPHLIKFDNAKEGVNPEGRWESEPIPPPEESTGSEPKKGEEPKVPTYNKVDDECCEQKLLVHLQANVGYYSRACWVLQDPTERVMLLDTLFASLPTVRNAIDPTPVAVNGNYVAFSFNGAEAPEPDPSPELTPRSDIVSLPTRGLFAETHLSNCNACEQRDVTRFWKWEESPCPEKAPSIEPISPGPKGQATTVQPASLPNPVVQVMNAPNAPDPTGLAAALNLLGQPNIFRDMSTRAEVSKLLEGLIAGSVSLAQAKEMANKAKDALASGAAGKGSGDSTRSAPSEPSASNQIDKLDAIRYATDKGLITQEQKQDAAAGVLGGERLPGADGAGPGTGGGGTAGTVAGSSSSAALPLIAAFAARTGTSPWKLNRVTVATRLRDLVTNSNLVKQAGLNLCGPAAFVRVWVARDPVAFVSFAVELFEQGHSKIGDYEVRPDADSLLGEDYATLLIKYGAQLPPQADWMVLGSLRDAENFFFDYEGKPEEDASAITLPGEVEEWLEAAGAHTRIRDETNLFFTKGLDHAKSLSPTASSDILVLINSPLIGEPVPFVLKFTPNHYIKLESTIRTIGSNVEFEYWSFGDPIRTRSVDKATFEKHYYGAIIAER